jgi:hypothetical protein
MTRKLTLKKDVLAELSSAELTEVVGGTRDTLFSCLTYVSCNPLDCVLSRQVCLEG